MEKRLRRSKKCFQRDRQKNQWHCVHFLLLLLLRIWERGDLQLEKKKKQPKKAPCAQLAQNGARAALGHNWCNSQLAGRTQLRCTWARKRTVLMHICCDLMLLLFGDYWNTESELPIPSSHCWISVHLCNYFNISLRVQCFVPSWQFLQVSLISYSLFTIFVHNLIVFSLFIFLYALKIDSWLP